MSFASVNGIDIYDEVHGGGPPLRSWRRWAGSGAASPIGGTTVAAFPAIIEFLGGGS